MRDAKTLDRLKQLVLKNLTDLRTQAGVDPERVGIIGYSLGGFFATYVASRKDAQWLRAAVVYYGMYDVPELVKDLRIPLLAFQGKGDTQVGFLDHALAMQQVALGHQRQFELVMYSHAEHGFDYERSPAYDPAAALDAWSRTIAFLDTHMKRK